MSGPRLRLAIEAGDAGLGLDDARDALFAWLLARSRSGALVLRNDLAAAETGEAERHVIDDLLWLGLGWDEGLEAQGEHGPYRRSQRLDLYRSAAEDLLRRGLAYRCACPEGAASHPPCACRSAAGLDESPGRGGGGWRVVFRGASTGDPDDFVLLRRDGGPGPELAAAVDDAMMGITHVVSRAGRRSAARRALLHEALGTATAPRSIELPPICGETHSPIGRGEAAPTVERLRRQGYPPEAVLNLLAHLGGASNLEQELLTREEMLAGFARGGAIGECGAFDRRRLDRLSRRHLARMSQERLAGLAAEHLAGAGLLRQPPSAEEHEWAGAVARLYAERLARMGDLPAAAGLLFHFDPGRCLADETVARTLRKAPSRRVVEALMGCWSTRGGGEELTAARVHALIAEVRRTTGAKGKPLYDAFRVALTGGSDGPDFAQFIAIIERGSRLPLPRPVAGCRERAERLLAATGSCRR